MHSMAVKVELDVPKNVDALTVGVIVTGGANTAPPTAATFFSRSMVTCPFR